LRGKDYLEVKWRLVWFREEHPDWSICTYMNHHCDEYSVMQCQIKDSNGNKISSGYKREDKKHFQDHLEKAETGAVGRALAMLGYGTQFDGGELAEGDRLADAPVQPKEKKDGAKEELLNNIRGQYAKVGAKVFDEVLKEKKVSDMKELTSSVTMQTLQSIYMTLLDKGL
jgi:hypothetical protein